MPCLSCCLCVKDTQTICSQCCKMMHLCWFTLLLCLSASAESNAVWKVSGESVTLKCSFAECSSIIKGYDGMYLYQIAKERTEVFYYHPNPGSTDKITPGTRYTDRIQTNGSLKYHTITISNLTVDDSGFYKCIFIKFPDVEDECSVYTLFIRGVSPCSESAVVALALTNEKSPLLVLILIAAITLLVTMIFIMVIVPRVKRWRSSSRTTSDPQVPNDNVYEDMNKNGFRPAREQPSSSPNDA